MPFWLALGSALLGAYQSYQGAQAQRQALQSASQGLSPEELGELRRGGTANIRLNLGRRGLLSSGLLPGSLATLERQIGMAQAGAKRETLPYALQLLQGQAQQPSLLGSIVPLMLQYGVRSPQGGWWVPPYQTVTP